MSSDVTEDAGVDASSYDVTDDNLISSNGDALCGKSDGGLRRKMMTS